MCSELCFYLFIVLLFVFVALCKLYDFCICELFLYDLKTLAAAATCFLLCRLCSTYVLLGSISQPSMNDQSD